MLTQPDAKESAAAAVGVTFSGPAWTAIVILSTPFLHQQARLRLLKCQGFPFNFLQKLSPQPFMLAKGQMKVD
jgi:hypothetical protein